MDEQALATIALNNGMTPAEAVALPVAVESAAKMVGMTVSDIINRCKVNAELSTYIAETCMAVVKREGE